MNEQYPEPDEDMAQWMATHPAEVWKFQEKNSPALMAKVDTMLIGGATPEWILQRQDFFRWPVAVQTAFLNSLHWRQSELGKRAIV